MMIIISAVSSSQIIHPNVPPPPLPNTSPPTTVASPIPMADDAPLEADRDRDQEEELVYNEERRRTVTMDDTNSLRSSSIQLNTANTTRDGLNESVASNPLDESAAVYRSSMKATDQMGPGSGTGTPLHGQDDRRSPPLDLPPPPPISSSHLSTSSASAPHQAPPSFPPPPVPSSTLFQTTSSLRKPEIFDRSDQGMSSPPLASIPPSLPAAQSSYSRGAYSSREDLRSYIPSRSTVREIPVQRAPSSVTSVLDYRMPSSYAAQPQENPDEYYRREILTRTIVTRSTEALSQPPLGRSSPIERYISYPDPNTREERTVDYKVTYHRDIEEEERRIREDQERRRREEEDRRRREEEARRLWELKEREILERMRTERELKEKYFEQSILDRERAEKDRIEHDRLNREAAEMERRREWERRENERRALEEAELAKRRQLEKERLELERQEEERRERERLERERLRLEAERAAAEEAARRQAEVERIERERIERERLEIERIERIKRERQEREERERQREKEEEERLRKEREELLRIERERRELEIKERELLVIARREAEERERQRIEDEAREARRRQEERREAELLAEIQRQADERERLRRLQEREEQERLERIRREQQRIDLEKADAERRERERAEEERRERELLEASQRKKEQREKERLQDLDNERKRQEEEERARQQREAERRAAAERERQRREEEDKERIRIAELERAAAMRRAEREAELDRQRERDELDRKAREIADMEKRENERRERERLEEERSIAELKEKEKRNQEIRDRERREAAEREAARKMDDRRSRDKLDIIVRERTEKERFESEKRRLLAEKEALNKKKHHLLSSETLQKLTRPPYFSRDNLNTEVTTKVERQVIERIDRNLWVDEVPVQRQAISYSLDTTNDENQRDRLYNANDLTRNGSAKASRYHRARMDKARRDFYSGAPDSTEGVTDRFRKSVDDLTSTSRHPAELRGPLLSRFHDGEFKRPTDYSDMPYPRVGPSPYSQEFERLLEETERKYAAYRMRISQPNLYTRNRHWSTSYLETDVDTGRHEMASTTRQVPETDLDMVHSRRAESVVDYHRQSRRDQPEPVATDNHARSRSADYLMDRRTREETEVPENQLQKTMGESPRDSRLSEHELRFIKSTEKLTVPDWYREHRRTARPTDVDDGTLRRASRDALEGIDIPRGMFDKYRDEIEHLRRSRTSLYDPNAASNRQDPQTQSAPRFVQDVRKDEDIGESRNLPGYTVSEVPSNWNYSDKRTSRVVEVADTFVGPRQVVDRNGAVSLRYGGRVTIEEVLDTIFQQTAPQPSHITDTTLPLADDIYQGSADAPGIYTHNYMLMEQLMRQPERAESLLKNEQLYVRCSHCHRTVRDDPEAQAYMSRIAREGYATSGRGSVNIRLASPQMAQAYVTKGWSALSAYPLHQLLFYYTVPALVAERKEPSLISLCRRYEPREKFILSVSIIADIEHCPETPPPEVVSFPQSYVPSTPLRSPFDYQQSQAMTPLTLIPTDV
ncbi:hypothetical protein WR25_12559 isoform B [Diploscapter pachys]|uniref:Apical junction molecule ajm1 alpha/beta domain-containing protein n=1 Tax=Diploscapter pachys TaxID=2018661 RepID=A0A2A2LBJ5_9BILA|nr:hypothetical protein WR25_12559 isoform B [Diploscapter pachys]